MALQVIAEIKQTEAKADEIVRNATNEAKDMVQKAKVEAQKQYDDVIAKAKEKANDLISKAVDMGNKEAEPVLAKGRQEAEGILNISEDKKINAVKLVVERIVKIHGNS